MVFLKRVLNVFWAIQATFVVKQPLYDLRTPLEPKKFTQGHLMKTEWLIADVTSVWSPDRVEHDIFGVISGVYWPIQATFVVGGAFLWFRNPPSEA